MLCNVFPLGWAKYIYYSLVWKLRMSCKFLSSHVEVVNLQKPAFLYISSSFWLGECQISSHEYMVLDIRRSPAHHKARNPEVSPSPIIGHRRNEKYKSISPSLISLHKALIRKTSKLGRTISPILCVRVCYYKMLASCNSDT